MALLACKEHTKPHKAADLLSSAAFATSDKLLTAPAPIPTPPAPALDAIEQLDARLGSELSIADVLEGLQHSQPTRLVPVGTTSTVFKMDLRAPFHAAFKVASAARPRAPRAEVAAYRLARCLKITTVPPAVTRRLAFADIQSTFVTSPRGTWRQIKKNLHADSQGMVTGVAIYWIPALHDLGIDTDRGLARIERYLHPGQDIPEAERSLATSVSTMAVFDYLIGNFDRYSGANARGDANATVVFLRDHDAAFPSRLPKAWRHNLLTRLRATERFSTNFVAALRALDRPSIDREFAKDPAATDGPLLPATNIEAMLRRRDEALAHIDNLIARYGSSDVLAFP